MKRLILLMGLALAGCATAPLEVKRLSPVIPSSKAPPQCVVVSVIKESPAEKAGLQVGETIKSVNGHIPADASALSDLVSTAPTDSDFEVLKKDGSTQHVKIHLNSTRPRLGSVCELAGWVKPGVTAAGNESVTIFDGPLAFTASGIIDKAIIFLRVRVTNNLDHSLEIGPSLFTAADGQGAPLPVLSPKEVMCLLYGDKGAHLLALKKKRKETLDAHDSVGAMDANAEEHCVGNTQGRLTSSDAQYAEANAQYLAAESLWPASYASGNVADGLIYLKESRNLPITLKALVEGHSMVVQLGSAQASEKQMKRSELVQFFQAQKRGNALRLTLKKGKVFVGKFATYDENEERVWFNTPSGGLLNSTSYSVENIRFAEPLEQVPATPAPATSDLN